MRSPVHEIHLAIVAGAILVAAAITAHRQHVPKLWLRLKPNRSHRPMASGARNGGST